MSTSRPSLFDSVRDALQVLGVRLAIIGALAGCTSLSPEASSKASTLLVAGYWNSLAGADLTIYDDGSMEYRRGSSKPHLSRLTAQESSSLQSFIRSDEFSQALRWLRDKAYEPGCCDQREVAFVFEGESLGYPVCDDAEVPEEVRDLIKVVNDLASRHFRRAYIALPFETCASRKAK